MTTQAALSLAAGLVVHRPERVASGAALVIDLHGSGGSPEVELELSGMRELADRRGFVVAAPRAAVRTAPDGQRPGGWAWNVPDAPFSDAGLCAVRDDIEYLRALVAELVTSHRTDPRRTYLMGYSGGARMACALAARIPEQVAAVAAIAGLRAGRPAVADARPPDPVPVIAFHGQLDPVNPFDGDDSPRWGHSVQAAAERWVRRNGVLGPPHTSMVSSTVRCHRYRSSDGSGDVVLYVATQDGHTWPGSSAPGRPSDLGPQTQEISASHLAWDFFEEHRRGSLSDG